MGLLPSHFKGLNVMDKAKLKITLIKEFLQNRDIHAKFYGILSIR
jgi:hypothetical protein